jgi:hypothetical protein
MAVRWRPARAGYPSGSARHCRALSRARSFDELAAAAAEGARELGIGEYAFDRGDLFVHGVREQEVAAGFAFDALRCGGCADDGQAHGEAFENLVLDAARDAQRRDGNRGAREEFARIVDEAGDGDAGVRGERLDLVGGSRADDREAHAGPLGAQAREDLVHEPHAAVDVRQVVHHADEHEVLGFGEVRLGLVVREVDAVAQHE